MAPRENDLHDELAVLEGTVQKALVERDASSLPIVGFGELSVALALGSDRVAKRMPPFSSADFETYHRLIDEYVQALQSRGVSVAPTQVAGLRRDEGDVITYLVQPRLDAGTLGEALLRAVPVPEAEHPLLIAIGDAVMAAVDDRVSVDAQVTNWSLVGGQATLVDVGTPMMWDAHGRPMMDMGPFLRMVPATVRPPLRLVMSSLMNRWKEPKGVLTDAAANLFREGLPGWAEPAAATWSRQLGTSIDLRAAEKSWKEDQRLWPMITRLKRTERWWRTKRNQPYDFFIQTTVGKKEIH